MNKSELKVNTCCRRQAQENAFAQDKFGFGFASHWLSKWRELCQPITERSKLNQGNAKLLSTLK